MTQPNRITGAFVSAPLALVVGALLVLGLGWGSWDPTGRSPDALPVSDAHDVALSIDRIDAFIADGTIVVTRRGLTVRRAPDPPAQLSAATLPAENLAGQARDARFATARAAIDTVQRAQRELNARLGTHLPVTGYFDGAWKRAVEAQRVSG